MILTLDMVTRPVTALAAIAALGLTPAATSVARADTGPGPADWHIAAIDDGPGSSSLHDVVAVGPNDAWAFGGERREPEGPVAPLARRWDGRSWTTVALPSGLQRVIWAADASGPRNVWAFGGGDPAAGNSYALRWDGRRWRVTGRWPAGQIIFDAEVIGPRDVWAFGGYGTGEGIGTWHFDGRRWTRADPPAGALAKASAVASDDVWAVGASLDHMWGDLLTRWDGRRWNEVVVPGLPHEEDHHVGFRDVHAASARDVWIVGEETRADGDVSTVSPLLMHFDGRTWQRVEPSPQSRAQLFSAVMPDGRGGIWVRPDYQGPSDNPDLLHYGHGRWSEVRLPKDGGEGGVSDLAAVPRAAVTWAVGGLSSSGTDDSHAAIWEGGTPPR